MSYLNECLQIVRLGFTFIELLSTPSVANMLFIQFSVLEEENGKGGGKKNSHLLSSALSRTLS